MMYDKFLDKICMDAQEVVIQRIVHEFLCLFEIVTIDQTSDNALNKLEHEMISSLLDDAIDQIS